MKRSLKLLAAAVATATGLSLAACAPGGTVPSDPSDQPETAPAYVPVNIGVGADAAYAAFFVADQLGLFAEAGLDVTLTPFSTGGDALAALGAGQIQMTQSSPATITSIIANNPSITAFVQTVDVAGINKVVLRNGVESATDVKSFGYVKGLSQYMAYAYFEENGVDPATINWVAAGAGDMPALIQRGDIDGFFLWEPWPTNVTTAGSGSVVATATEFPDLDPVLVNWLASTDDWLAANEATAKAVTAVLGEAIDIIDDDPQVAADAVEQAVAIKAADALVMVGRLGFGLQPITGDVVAATQQIGDFFVSTGAISATPDLKSELVLDWSW
ncbi:MAG: ABC transporter substrate-binding protein [Microbacterium sp.]|nr:ABC transporter substrate-binding protein [Microbacterium sp.]